MTRYIFKPFALIAIITITVIQLISCEKDPVEAVVPVCDIKGIYSGTSLASTGVSSTLTYNFKENNFTVGSVTPTGPAVTFGSYTNTCDSVILTVYYNSSYYTLRGKLSNNNATIGGTFLNTTTSEYGTFTISK